MFKVILRKWLHASLSTAGPEDRVVEAEFELPFPPFPGLKVMKGMNEYDFKEVYWESDQNLFRCYEEDDQTYYESGKGIFWHATREQMDALVKEYTGPGGWKEETKETVKVQS